jgi:hypothetical protein
MDILMIGGSKKTKPNNANMLVQRSPARGRKCILKTKPICRG